MTEVATAPTYRKFKITTTKLGIRTIDSEKVNGKLGQVKPPPCRKRKPSEAPLLDDGQRGKRPKKMMDKIQCGALLKEVMSHRGFAEPKLKIPLGRIKEKLEGNAYSNADEFAHEVMLTFKKATFFNPVGHAVHEYAKEMNSIFCRRWRRLLEAKFDDEEKGDFVRVVGDVQKAKEPCLQSASRLRVDDKKKSVGVARAKCPSCASLLACHCLQKKAGCAPQASMSGRGVSKHPLESNRRSSSSQETPAGIVVIHEEEKSPCFPTPPAEEGWYLRAAMLKSRFADTISRATQYQSAARSRMFEESQRLEKEKARIEAEINDLKRDRERAAAKMAKQEMAKMSLQFARRG